MWRRTTLVFTRVLFAALVLLVSTFATPAEARPQWLTAFVGEYPTATQLFTCGACHRNFDGPTDDLVALIVGAESEGGLNPYGNAFKDHDGEDHPASALVAIENLDSDQDGTSNIDEILTGAGFTPGYDCDSYQTAVNAPANLAAYVDPEDPGCGVVTTTQPPTTLTSTTTSLAASTTTSTTVPVEGCGAPVSGASPPTATDCLFILHAAIGLDACDPECLCAPKGSLPVSATDALVCLRAAVGELVPLDCACGGTSTTTSSSTSTTTSTSTSTSTSSSTTSSSTTTTVVNPVDSGRAVYDARCASCHKAGSHDTSGFASDLRTKSGLLVSNLGSIDPIMSGITLTQKEIDDLTAFLDSL